MLGKAELLDFHGLKHICRSSSQTFSEDRWALTGMASGMLDAIHSTTCWQIAMQNRLIGNAIAVEVAGEKKKFESQVRHFNWVASERQRHLKAIFANFDPYGCFDFWSTYSGHRLANYFNILVPGTMSDYQRIVDTANVHVDGCSCETAIANSYDREVLLCTKAKGQELIKLLDEAGEYYKNNHGSFMGMSQWEEAPDIVEKFGKPPIKEEEDRVTTRIYFDVCRNWARRVAELKKVPFDNMAFDAVCTKVDANQTLVDIVNEMSAHRT